MFEYQQTFELKLNDRKTIPLSLPNTKESYQHAVETSSGNSSQPYGIVPNVKSSYQRRRDQKRKSAWNDSAKNEIKKQKRVQENQFDGISEFGKFNMTCHMYANLVILQYLGSPFTWDKVLKVFRPLPNHVKNQRLLVHSLYCEQDH